MVVMILGLLTFWQTTLFGLSSFRFAKQDGEVSETGNLDSLMVVGDLGRAGSCRIPTVPLFYFTTYFLVPTIDQSGYNKATSREVHNAHIVQYLRNLKLCHVRVRFTSTLLILLAFEYSNISHCDYFSHLWLKNIVVTEVPVATVTI